MHLPLLLFSRDKQNNHHLTAAAVLAVNDYCISILLGCRFFVRFAGDSRRGYVPFFHMPILQTPRIYAGILKFGFVRNCSSCLFCCMGVESGTGTHTAPTAPWNKPPAALPVRVVGMGESRFRIRTITNHLFAFCQVGRTVGGNAQVELNGEHRRHRVLGGLGMPFFDYCFTCPHVWAARSRFCWALWESYFACIFVLLGTS